MVALKGETPPLRACMPVSGPFNLQYGDIQADSPDGRAYKYLFHHRRQDYEASPINFVDGARTPFHITWGERDLQRILNSNQAMVEALKQAGCPVTTEVLHGASHFDTHLALANGGHAWYARLREAFA